MQMSLWSKVLIMAATSQVAAAQDIQIGSGSLLDLLLEPACYGHFASAEIGKEGCKAVFVRDDGRTMQFASWPTVPAEMEFISQVKIGRRYAFPQCFFDFLDAEQIYECVRTLPAEHSFEEIEDHAPFRATVLDQAIGRLTYSIILREPGGRVHHLRGLLSAGNARQRAELLWKGASYEFPAILRDAGLLAQVREAKKTPKSRMEEVLSRYIGVWKGRTEAVSYITLRMRCDWQADGQGIWREITYEHGPDVTPPPADVARVAYSEASKCYLSWNPATDALKFRIQWDEKTKTFTTLLPPDEEGVERYNTATFVDDDHIEWKTFSKLADGRVLEMNSGSYERLSREPNILFSQAPPPRAIDVLGRQIHDFAKQDQEMNAPLPGGQRLTWNTPAYRPAPNRPDVPTFDKPSDTPVIEVVDATLAGLEASLPFRAKIVSKSIQPHNITLQLQHTGGNLQTIEAADFKLAEKPVALALAKLKEGEVHEFPHCLSSKPSNTALSPAMSRLQPFIGSWSQTIRGRDGVEEPLPCLIRYFASADGSGLWHEVEMSGRQKLERLVFDEVSGSYSMAAEHAPPEVKTLQGHWDEPTRTLKLVKSFTNAPPGAVREESTFQIISATQIHWRTRLIAADESVVRERTGTMNRVEP
ncbi:MAG: hypothetical protein JNN17_02375 [Verrucomicrobiaceae bacterium]|nr:hypothetical protein [Verrucomicrobiaceae bacterium]